MTLDDARNKIDTIDTQLLDLFLQRMDTVKKVAEIKKENGFTVFAPNREREILDRVAKAAPSEYTGYASAFYQYLMEMSKNCQRENLSRTSTEKNAYLSNFNPVHEELARPRVVVQGCMGSFAMEAAQKMYPDANISYVPSWEQVLSALEEGSSDYGVLPVENSVAGTVAEVFDLLIRYKFSVVKALPLPVTHCLLGVRGATIRDIKRVYTHPHAFPQCSDFFHRHHKFEKVPYTNTALAAEYVARTGDPSFAAIASKECAHIYGLSVLEENIQQNDDNCTRFFSVSKRQEILPGANKITLVVTLPHVTGSLYRMLGRFALSGLNICKIESRPCPGKNFEYYFYIDFIGSTRSENIQTLLGALSEELPSFNFLGNYVEN